MPLITAEPLGMAYGAPPVTSWANLSNLLGSAYRVDATGKKVWMFGPVVRPDRATGAKSYVKVRFVMGSVVNAGGSLYRTSLQDVDTTAGLPARGDGTADQSVDTAIPAAGGYMELTLGAGRNLSPGDMVAVCWEFDPGGKLGSDRFDIDYCANTLTPGATSFDGAATYAHLGAANVVLVDSDGGIAVLATNGQVTLITASGITGFSQDTGTADEYGNVLVVPWATEIDGIWWAGYPDAGTADYTMALRSAAYADLKTVVVKGYHHRSTTTPYFYARFFATPYVPAAGETLYITARPTVDGAPGGIKLAYFDVNAAGDLAYIDGGAAMHRARFLDVNTYVDALTTRRMQIGPIFSRFSDAAGGFPIIPGL